MNIELEKYKLIEWLIAIDDIDILNRLKKIKENPQKKLDWSEEISEIEKALIKVGLKNYEEGNTFTHKQVLEELNEKYGL
jgi:predicted transcriptional regulator